MKTNYKLLELFWVNKYLVVIIFLSLFINLYKINSLMMFIGDMGRDFLAARDMIMTGIIPLVGIQSSVVWLHQGPLSIYLIGLSFLLSNFNPVAPAVMYAIFGVATTFLVYKLGKEYFNVNVGLLSALFFATSPLIIANVRMPYHSASIPFFASILFLLIYKYLKGNQKLIFYIFLVFGLLLQLELSNFVLIGIFVILYIRYKPKIDKKQILFAISGFLLGILPFIIYDLSNKFVQTLGFPLWVIHRIANFFGISLTGTLPSTHESNVIYRIYQQLVSTVFPFSKIISYLTLVVTGAVVFIRFKTEKSIGLFIIIIWFLIPVIAYLIHRAPGTAYFPVLFPAISLLVGYVIYQISAKYKFIIFIFVLGCILNLILILQNEYFLATVRSYHAIPPESYGIGTAYEMQDQAVEKIITNAGNNKFYLKGGGFLSTLSTGIDNFKFIAWYKGGKLSDDAKILYLIYNSGDKEIPEKAYVIFKNDYFTVTKNEN